MSTAHSRVELPLVFDFPGGGRAAHPYAVVDVFTTRALEGNQLGVFTNAAGFDAALMQQIARELNFAETVFVLPAEGDGDVRIRIFTPRSELPFAGHPVLGAAFVVGSALGSDAPRIETESGTVAVELTRDGGEVVFGRFARPAPLREPFERVADLLSALGVDQSVLPVEAYSNGPSHVYVGLADEDAVASLRPDHAALAELGTVAANCFAGSGRRWTTRMFAPGLGVPEDPATGSAAGPLAMHLARHRKIDFDVEIEIHQGEQIDRPSVLFARVQGDADDVRSVEVGGSAVLVAAGRYRIQ